MELSARGWKRDHGRKVIAQKDLMEAEVGDFEAYYPSSTYITATSEVVSHPSRGFRIANERIEIRFAGKMNLNGDYLIRLTHRKQEIAKLFFLLHPEFDEMLREVVVTELQREEPKAVESGIDPELLRKNVDDCDFSVRTMLCFKNENIVLIGDLVQRTEAELLRVPNFGRKSLNEVKEALAQFGLHLGMDMPNAASKNASEIISSFRRLLTQP